MPRVRHRLAMSSLMGNLQRCNPSMMKGISQIAAGTDIEVHLLRRDPVVEGEFLWIITVVVLGLRLAVVVETIPDEEVVAAGVMVIINVVLVMVPDFSFACSSSLTNKFLHIAK